MMLFAVLIAVVSALCAGAFYLIRKKVVSVYRGGLFIILSGLYFAAFFSIAYLMRDGLK